MNETNLYMVMQLVIVRCPLCRELFKSKTTLRNHVRQHCNYQAENFIDA